MRQSQILTYQPGNLAHRPWRRLRWIIAAVAVVCLAGWIFGVRMRQPVATRTRSLNPDRQDILDRQLPEVKFDGTPLKQAIDFLSEVSGARIAVDWDHLAADGVTPDTPVGVNLRNVTLRKAIAVVMDDLRLRWLVPGHFEETDDGTIAITSQGYYDRTHVVTATYDIRDLINEPRQVSVEPDRKERANEVCHVCTETVVTESWAVNGGSIGRIQECGGFLIVAQTPERHRQVRELLDQLRSLYVGPKASGYGPGTGPDP